MSEPLYSAAEKRLATQVANRVDAALCGMDPLTIVLVVCAVLNVAINCWQASHKVKPEDAAAELAKRCRTYGGRKRLEQQLTQRIWQAQAPRDLRVYQAKLIARAIIDEALAEENGAEMVLLMRGEKL